MTDKQGCHREMISLVAVTLALLVSVCINVVLWFRTGATMYRDKDVSCCSHVDEEQIHQEQQENPHIHREQQENPIYGNISTDRRGVCYEMMTTQRTRDCKKNVDPDLNYASLDLKMAKNRKKHRQQQSQAQGRAKLQDQPQVHLTPPMNSFLDVDADMDASLSSRETSSMVSHSSIYLNSQQIAQEAEEMERERRISMELENMGWKGVQGYRHGGSRQWDGDQECTEAQDKVNGSNGNICIDFSGGKVIQRSSDHFIHIFSQGRNQPDHEEEESNL